MSNHDLYKLARLDKLHDDYEIISIYSKDKEPFGAPTGYALKNKETGDYVLDDNKVVEIFDTVPNCYAWYWLDKGFADIKTASEALKLLGSVFGQVGKPGK